MNLTNNNNNNNSSNNNNDNNILTGNSVNLFHEAFTNKKHNIERVIQWKGQMYPPHLSESRGKTGQWETAQY